MQLDGYVQAVQDILRRCYKVRATPAEVYGFVAAAWPAGLDPQEAADDFVAARQRQQAERDDDANGRARQTARGR